MDRNSQFPLENTRLPLPSGGSVVVVNRIISSMHGQPGGAFTVQYQSTIPASDRAARAAEAREVAQLHQPFAQSKGLDRIRAEICNSSAAAQMREAAEAGFQFRRNATGAWVADPSHDL